jgi:hypothetical protein
VEPATGYVARYLIGCDPRASPVGQDPTLPYVADRFVYSIKTDGSFTIDWQVSKSPVLAWVQSIWNAGVRDRECPANPQILSER